MAPDPGPAAKRFAEHGGVNTIGKRARIKAKGEAEFRRWEKLAEKTRKRHAVVRAKDDPSSLTTPASDDEK